MVSELTLSSAMAETQILRFYSEQAELFKGYQEDLEKLISDFGSQISEILNQSDPPIAATSEDGEISESGQHQWAATPIAEMQAPIDRRVDQVLKSFKELDEQEQENDGFNEDRDTGSLHKVLDQLSNRNLVAVEHNGIMEGYLQQFDLLFPNPGILSTVCFDSLYELSRNLFEMDYLGGVVPNEFINLHFAGVIGSWNILVKNGKFLEKSIEESVEIFMLDGICGDYVLVGLEDSSPREENMLMFEKESHGLVVTNIDWRLIHLGMAFKLIEESLYAVTVILWHTLQGAYIHGAQMWCCKGFSSIRALWEIAEDEFHPCGSAAAVPFIQKRLKMIGDYVEVRTYERLSPLICLEARGSFPIKVYSSQKIASLFFCSRQSFILWLARKPFNIGALIVSWGNETPGIAEQPHDFVTVEDKRNTVGNGNLEVTYFEFVKPCEETNFEGRDKFISDTHKNLATLMEEISYALEAATSLGYVVLNSMRAVTSGHIKKQAKVIAKEWTSKLDALDVDVSSGNSSVAHVFLQLLATFGVIEVLGSKGRQFDAIDLAFASGLTEQFSHVPLLISYLQYARKASSSNKPWSTSLYLPSTTATKLAYASLPKLVAVLPRKMVDRG